MGPAYWDDLIASSVRGRKWVAAFDVLAGLDRFADRMARHGADSLFVLAGTRGLGELPTPGFTSWHLLDIEAADLMEGIRRYESSLLDLPSAATVALDEFDPERRARVFRTTFAVDHPVAGRPSYGARPQRWVDALEDKTRVDELWDAAGVGRAPSAIVPPDEGPLREATASLDHGSGTVWAADNASGWHGGASYVRWLRDGYDGEVAQLFAASSARVRVMPFLDGLPCSIHGMVIGDDVIVFRPVELLILRRRGSPKFFYAGTAATWDPPLHVAAAMREAALRTGEFVRDHHGYRGAFNLDGVLTEDGWLPTEFNARFSAGLGALQRGFDVPLYHLHLMVVAGEEVDFRPRDLERELLGAVEENRESSFGAPIETISVADEREARLVRDGDRFRRANDDEVPTGTLRLGPAAAGSYLRYSSEQSELGPSLAPTVAAVLAFADAEWGTGTGGLEAAADTSK